MKAQCTLLAAKLVQAPTLATLWINDGSQGKSEPPRARGCAFRLTVKEARTTLDVVAGMVLFLTLLIIFIYAHMCSTYDRYGFNELFA